MIQTKENNNGGTKKIKARNNGGTTKKILIADDHKLLRLITKKIISETDDMVVAREVKAAGDVFDLIDNGDVDVLILQTLLSGKSGYEILRNVKEKNPMLPVLMISTYYDDIYERSAFMHGADGFVRTDKMVDELVSAIRIVRDGKKYYNFYSEKPLQAVEH